MQKIDARAIPTTMAESMRDAEEIPSAVIELAKKSETIETAKVRKRLFINVSIIILAIVLMVLDLWLISQGWVETDPGRKLAAFVAVGSGALFIVGLMSFLSLILVKFRNSVSEVDCHK